MAKVLALIPARAGSKRVPGKNMRLFHGYPILKYSIDAAIKAEIFDEILVSTEDASIAAEAQAMGAQVPFLRSASAASDLALFVDVFNDVLRSYETIGKKFDYFCCILATAPLLDFKHLVKAYHLLLKESFDQVIPVVMADHPPEQGLHCENGFLKMNDPKAWTMRSQDFRQTFFDTGSFYFIKTSSYLEQRKLILEKAYPLVIPSLYVQDINTEEEWRMAEAKYSWMQQQGV